MRSPSNNNYLIFILKFYKKYISPFLVRNLGHSCRFTPTCSEYMIYSIEKFGTLKGLGKGIVRLLKCNPLSRGGFDPVKS